MLRRAICLSVLTTFLVGLTASPGVAKRPEPFAITCGEVDYTITAANGKWAIGMDVESSTHFIPQSFRFVLTNADDDVIDEEVLVKKGHRNQATITCRFGETFIDPVTGEELTFTGIAKVVKRP